MRQTTYLLSLLIIVLFHSINNLYAAVKVAPYFGNNMVLQRDIPNQIWGEAEKNEIVTIVFNGFTKKTKSDDAGKWSFLLPAMEYGGPFNMTIKGNSETVTFRNILIGDLWVCSGQSNMEFSLAEAYTGKEEILTSENKNIRLLTVPKTIQTQEQNDIPDASWKECNPNTTSDFSAVGYFFGKNLYKELNIPIGLIDASWGGTLIETWTSWEASMNNSQYKKYKGKTVEQAFGYTAPELNNINSAIRYNDKGTIDKWYLPESDVTGWEIMYAPKIWDGELKNEKGVVWFRKKITLPENVAGKKGKLHLGEISDIDVTYFNGVLVGSMRYSDIRNYDVTLKAGKNLVVVRNQVMGGPGGMKSKAEDIFLEVDGKNYSLAGDWKYKPALLLSSSGLKNANIGNNFASLLFNGMIHPLTKHKIKGVIWYQGEGNSWDAYRYRELFPILINDWRRHWGYNLPFLWVQLASFRAEETLPRESRWAELREAQNMTLSLPNTGQAVITDIGDANNIHPRNKKDVGYRLAQSALKVVYGEDILGEGPAFESIQIKGNKVIVKFSNVGKGLTTRDKNKYGYVYGFSIAGEDKKFVWAKAYIDGKNVIVFSDEVTSPVAVRYGWADNPTEINIVNSAGLLASPFRTDTWKGITEKQVN